MSFLINHSYLLTTSSRRGISDIITTLLLISATVVGGSLIFYTFSGNEQIQDLDVILDAPAGESKANIRLFGYDARDGSTLSGISDLGNTVSGGLQTDEYIILYVRNTGNTILNIDGINVNNILHTWHVATEVPLSSSIPATGTFAVISTFNGESPTMAGTSVLVPQIGVGNEVRLVVKLSSDFIGNSIITTNDAIRISVNIVGSDFNEFIITSGNTI